MQFARQRLAKLRERFQQREELIASIERDAEAQAEQNAHRTAAALGQGAAQPLPKPAGPE